MSGPPPVANGAPPAGAPAPMQYIPEPFERPYYLGLFNVADVQQKGQIGGAEAVQFLSRSKLPMETLKHIWTLCDQPQTNYLDHKKFAVAIRFIQCMQNQTRAQGARLESPSSSTLRPAMFEGVSGTVVPLPPDQSGAAPEAEGKPPMAPATPQRPPQPTVAASMRGAPSPIPPGAAPMRGAPSPIPPGAVTPQRGPSPSPSLQPSLSGAPPPPAATGPSSALTVQDPYGMSPADMARYQDICKEHAKPDGFVYGGEAVALFSKSGMPQNLLAAIWNMVDVPVDNRLDPVEFGMAMHLIVCVSKKGMPMPPSLPPSLAQLKQQQPPPGAAAAGGGPPPPVSPEAAAAPEPQAQQMPPPQPSPAEAAPPAQPEAPAIQTTGSGGGMSITDAFEGLDGPGAPPSYGAEEPAPEPVPTYQQQPPVQQAPPTQMSDAAAAPTPQMEQPTAMPAPQAQQPVVVQPTVGLSMNVPLGASAAPEPASIPEPVAATAAPATTDGSASEELAQARELLTKLQAENISLKARLSHFSEEEVEAQKELAMTVSEITRLNSVLTGLRSEVLEKKGRLSDLTAAVKASKDNVSMLNGLVQEETATRDALAEANQGLETALAVSGSAAAAAPVEYSAPQPAPAPVANDDVFGFSAAAQAPPLGEDQSQGSGPVPLSEPQVAAPPVESQPSSELMGPPSGEIVTQQQPSSEMLAAPPPAQQPAMDAFGAPAATSPAPSADVAFSGGPFAGVPQPVANADPAQASGHNRNMSTASAFGFGDDAAILGSGPSPFPPAEQTMAPQASPVAPAAPAVDQNALAEQRRKAKEADDLARQAEQASRSQMERVHQLRQEAEAAQAQAQRRQAEVEGKKKKKGMFGGGKQKKENKELEQIMLDAKMKQDALLQAQGQVNDAQALAMETRREADRLRKESEDAELAAASSASLQHSQPAPTPAEPQQQQPMYAQQPPPQQQVPPQTYAYPQAGQPVMSNGNGAAYQIPTPAGANAYDNPFSS